MQRAISLAVSVCTCREESRREAHRRPRATPSRHHCLFFLTSSRFCRPGILPMPCYHGYTVTGVVRTQKYQTVLVSFRDGRRGAQTLRRGWVARRSGMREPLCVLLQRGFPDDDDMRRRERLRRDYFSLLRSFRVIHSCVCYFN